MRFGTGWGNAVVSPYEVHCLSAPSPAPKPLNNGWTVYEYRPQIDIHIFARRSTNAEPAQPGQMQREVDRILATFKTSVSAGVLVTPAAWRAAHDPENVGPFAYWHPIGSCSLLYCKVNNAS